MWMRLFGGERSGWDFEAGACRAGKADAGSKTPYNGCALFKIVRPTPPTNKRPVESFHAASFPRSRGRRAVLYHLPVQPLMSYLPLRSLVRDLRVDQLSRPLQLFHCKPSADHTKVPTRIRCVGGIQLPACHGLQQPQPLQPSQSHAQSQSQKQPESTRHSTCVR